MSVIIPTRERAALAVETIFSVLAQTFDDLEVVVCDDRSTDDTAERVRAFGAPVRYLRVQRSGRPGLLRNRGVAAANGDLLAFLDDDDLWEPAKLARQIELFDRRPDLDAVYTIGASCSRTDRERSTPRPRIPTRLATCSMKLWPDASRMSAGCFWGGPRSRASAAGTRPSRRVRTPRYRSGSVGPRELRAYPSRSPSSAGAWRA